MNLREKIQERVESTKRRLINAQEERLLYSTGFTNGELAMLEWVLLELEKEPEQFIDASKRYSPPTESFREESRHEMLMRLAKAPVWSGRSKKEIQEMIRQNKQLGAIAGRVAGVEKDVSLKEMSEALVNFGEWVLNEK